MFYERGQRRTIAARWRTRSSASRRAASWLSTTPRSPPPHFNWLIMAMPLNRAMLLGDDGATRRRPSSTATSTAGVRTFLAAYGPR